MSAVPRVFLLLRAYEKITERESAALRRGDIDHAIDLEDRKLCIARTMAEEKMKSGLSPAQNNALTERVRLLAIREKENLAFIGEQMGQVKTALNEINQAAHRSRRVRRGYADTRETLNQTAEVQLGRA